MNVLMANGLASACGGLVGFSLGMIGGGGSILAVPLLVYVVGVSSPHIAIGTSAVAVAASALANLVGHARARTVRWPCALVFASAGVLGAYTGSSVAKAVEGQHLLALFGILMIVVGLIMLRPRRDAGDAMVRLTRATAPRLLPQLVAIGFGVGLLSGFFGIGGGFLIVPGLMLATGMPLLFAIGTSLVAVTAFATTTAGNYALSGLVDWPLAGLFVLGGVFGGLAGIQAGKALSGRKRALHLAFAGVVIAVGIYIVARGVSALAGA